MRDIEPTRKLFVNILLLRSMAAIATRMAPLDEVVELLDMQELESERDGVQIPREALKQIRPLLLAAADFQKVIQALEDAPEFLRGGDLKIDGNL